MKYWPPATAPTYTWKQLYIPIQNFKWVYDPVPGCTLSHVVVGSGTVLQPNKQWQVTWSWRSRGDCQVPFDWNWPCPKKRFWRTLRMPLIAGRYRNLRRIKGPLEPQVYICRLGICSELTPCQCKLYKNDTRTYSSKQLCPWSSSDPPAQKIVPGLYYKNGAALMARGFSQLLPTSKEPYLLERNLKKARI